MNTLILNKYLRFGWMLLVTFGAISCEDFVEIDPPTSQITVSSVFQNDATAKSAMAGIYSNMMEDNRYFTSGGNSITTITGLSGDEFVNYNIASDKIRIYTNNLTGTETETLWIGLYTTINQANAILEGMDRGSLSKETYNLLKGESLFIRAFCHFQLVNLFGEIPIATTTDYRINNKLDRSTIAAAYEQILADLEEAQDLLPEDFSANEGERIRPIKAAAMALRARAYLYIENWSEAEKYATAVILNPLFELEPDLNNVFLANSSEAIWQLRPVSPGFNTFDGNTYILLAVPKDVALAPEIMNAFELADERRSKWTASITIGGNKYNYPNKYKVRSGTDVTEYLNVLRLSEIYLIRAEARAHQNKIVEASADLNTIHNRAGLTPIVSATLDQLLSAVEHERQVELFCEWGHRWFDLKRTNRINAVMPLVKPAWTDRDKLYPIPQSEISNNPNLLPQNPGY